MHVCICICTYACIHTYTTYSYIYIYIHKYACMYPCTTVHAYICACMPAEEGGVVRIVLLLLRYAVQQVFLCMCCVYVCVCAYIYIYISTYVNLQVLRVCTCMCTRTYVCGDSSPGAPAIFCFSGDSIFGASYDSSEELAEGAIEASDPLRSACNRHM